MGEVKDLLVKLKPRLEIVVDSLIEIEKLLKGER